jgi:hypothetical protein
MVPSAFSAGVKVLENDLLQEWQKYSYGDMIASVRARMPWAPILKLPCWSRPHSVDYFASDVQSAWTESFRCATRQKISVRGIKYPHTNVFTTYVQ